MYLPYVYGDVRYARFSYRDTESSLIRIFTADATVQWVEPTPDNFSDLLPTLVDAIDILISK